MGVVLSVPLLVRFNWRAQRKVFVNLIGGLNLTFFSNGGTDYNLFIPVPDSFFTQVFGIETGNNSNSFMKTGFIAGTGVSLPLYKTMLKINFSYIVNFEDAIIGHYRFYNIKSKTTSEGEYKLSCNYFKLTLAFSMKKMSKKD